MATNSAVPGVSVILLGVHELGVDDGGPRQRWECSGQVRKAVCPRPRVKRDGATRLVDLHAVASRRALALGQAVAEGWFAQGRHAAIGVLGPASNGLAIRVDQH